MLWYWYLLDYMNVTLLLRNMDSQIRRDSLRKLAAQTRDGTPCTSETLGHRGAHHLNHLDCFVIMHICAI